jgi:DNA-binding phage protein
MSYPAITHSDLEIELYDIAIQMKKSGLSSDFITAAVKVASEFEGVYDLMKMWEEENEPKEREEIIADIQDMIDDCTLSGKTEVPYIRFDDLDAIAKNVRAFKDSLRLIIENNGGLNKLSELTGIPQPSLSRFFSTVSMPKRVTLLKIAKALNLSAVEVATEWSR